MNNDEMVYLYLERRDITDERLLDAFRSVDRKQFLPSSYIGDPYIDAPIPIKGFQTTSQPYIIAKMLQELELDSKHKVLEVGFGSGYATAILSRLVKSVIATEILPDLFKDAVKRLKAFNNVKLQLTPGKIGWEKEAPYDRILVSAAPRVIPKELLSQLADGGIMIIPVGEMYEQKLFKVKKLKGKIITKPVLDCSFVPLLK